MFVLWSKRTFKRIHFLSISHPFGNLKIFWQHLINLVQVDWSLDDDEDDMLTEMMVPMEHKIQTEAEMKLKVDGLSVINRKKINPAEINFCLFRLMKTESQFRCNKALWRIERYRHFFGKKFETLSHYSSGEMCGKVDAKQKVV